MEFSTAARRPEPLVERLVRIKRGKESAQESRSSFISRHSVRNRGRGREACVRTAIRRGRDRCPCRSDSGPGRWATFASRPRSSRQRYATRHCTVHTPSAYRLREGRHRLDRKRKTDKWARNIQVGESSSPPRASIRISFFSNSSTTYLRSRQVSSFISTSGVAGKSRTDKLTAATTSVSSECSPSRRAPFPPEPARLRP